MAEKVVLVTGGNRGIGLEICRIFCKKLKDGNGSIILTARNEEEGKRACDQLTNDGYEAYFMQLDVTSKSSIQNLAKRVKQEFHGLDILINNAAIMYSSSKDKDVPYVEQVQQTLETNFFGLLNTYDALHPLLQNNSRVVNVTSRLGNLNLFGEELKEKFIDKDLDRDGLIHLMLQYRDDVKHNRYKEAGWPDQHPNSWLPAAYSVSKIAVTLLTRILAKECKIPGAVINCCCPGWCRSNIGGPKAPKSAESGAADIVNCALVAKVTSNGGFFKDGNLHVEVSGSK